MGGGYEAHEARVRRVARQLRERPAGRPVSIRKRAVSHQVPKRHDPKSEDAPIDLTDFNEVLEIDARNRLCVAESGVTFEDLVRATLPYGLVPMVVPELKTITVGGAVSGCSIESSSFRVGGFHDSCVAYEVVTARGEVLACAPGGENALLFEMVHGGFGTLGVLTKLEFRLAPAKRFVHLDHTKYDTLRAYRDAIRAHYERQDVTFLDGIIHSPREYVLSTGEFVDRAPYTHRYDWTRVYYRSTRARAEDYLETPQYFFRYDHGVTNVHPKSALGRLLFGKLFGSSQLLRLAERFPWLLGNGRPAVTVDVFVPFSRAEEFMDWYRAEVDFFPLWCVPYHLGHKYAWLSNEFAARTHDQLFLDLAIYGMEQPEGRNVYKLLEDELLAIGGLKTLISHNYYSEEDFWKTWNRENYARAKARTDPENAFRDLYDRTCRATMGVAG